MKTGLALLFILASSTIGQITNGLVAYFPFTGNANDSSGNNYNAVIHGDSLVTDRFGIPDRAYSFGPSYMTVPYAGISGTSPRTFSIWEKTNVPGNRDGYAKCLWGYGLGANGGMLTLCLNSDIEGYKTVNVGTADQGMAFRNDVADNIWHNLVVVVPNIPSPIANDIKVYLDGSLLSHTPNTDGEIPSELINTVIGTSTFIGANQYGTGSVFSGYLDDFRIYNRALSDSEIQILANQKPVLPIAPILGSPSLNAANIPVSTNLIWNPSIGAITYRVQLSTDSTFTTLLINDSTITGTSKAVGPLSNNTVYYWRVNAKNIVGTSAYSSKWKFTTAPVVVTVPPGACTLATPVTNAVNIPLSPTLTWNIVSSANDYRLQLSTSASFTPLALDNTGSPTSLQVGTLSGNTVYYWRVYARNSAGTGPWSNTQQFTTVSGTAIFGPVNFRRSSSAISISPDGRKTFNKDVKLSQETLPVKIKAP